MATSFQRANKWSRIRADRARMTSLAGSGGTRLRDSRGLVEDLRNAADRLPHLGLGDDEGRREADDVVVRLLRQHARVPHAQAELPCGDLLHESLVHLCSH